MEKNKKWLVYLCIVLFGGIGIYLTFISGNTSRYDSQIKAYQIDENEHYDSDGTIYYPIYYFKVGDKEYQCKAKSGSSSAPNPKKNIVYYDSKNPEKCLTQYEKSTSRVGGIICIVVSLLILVLSFVKPSKKATESFQSNAAMDLERSDQLREQMANVEDLIDKFQLIVKRVILGIIIFVLFLFNVFDFFIVRQTILSRNFIETTATLAGKSGESDSEITSDYVYTFEDKKGNQQEIVVSVFQDDVVENEIKIKYNEKDPQDFYEEGQTFDKSGLLWFGVKVVIMILLIVLFFQKKLLNKIHFSVGRS